MTPVPPSLRRLLLLVVLPLYLLDQATKWWIVSHFAHGEARPVIDGFFNLVRVHNQGVAFGFGNGTVWAPVVFLVVPLAALWVIATLWRRGWFADRVSRVAVALLLAGILGNLTDRLVQGFLLEEARGGSFWDRLSQGYVVDFLDFVLPLYDRLVPSSNGHWPAFNVADSCICVAAVLLFLAGWRGETKGAAAA
jgi:signal peptidase II